MAKIDLMLDEENELTFQLNIEGTRPAEANCRLFVESKDMSLSFDASASGDGEVSVVLPPLQHVLKEGKYDMSLEVIVDDKYFKPLTLEGVFEKSITVTAKPIAKRKRNKIVTSASLLEVKKNKKPKISENKRARQAEVKTQNNKISDKEIWKIIQALSKK